MTAKRRPTNLDDRVFALYQKCDGQWLTSQYVRAELRRVARKVRKLPTSLGSFYGTEESRICIRRDDVLALLKEAAK